MISFTVSGVSGEDLTVIMTAPRRWYRRWGLRLAAWLLTICPEVVE